MTTKSDFTKTDNLTTSKATDLTSVSSINSSTNSSINANINSGPNSSGNSPVNSVIAKSLLRANRLSRRLQRLEKRVTLYNGKLNLHRNWRLSIAAIFGIALFILVANPKSRLELTVFVSFSAVFSVLVIRTRKIEKHIQDLTRLRYFTNRQELRLRGLPSGRPWEVANRAAENVKMSRDLGVFGEHSLWTLIDETLTEGGQQRLIEWLSHSSPVKTDILKRQSLIQSLRPEAWFLTRLTLQGSEDFRLSSAQILLFLKKSFLKPGFRVLLVLVWITWLSSMSWIYYSVTNSGQIPFWPLPIFSVINFACLMRSSSPFKKGVGLSHHLSLLQPLFSILERRLKTSSRLQALCPVTKAAGPSREAKHLNRVLAFMSVEANPLVQLIVNLFSPWSLTAQALLEARRLKISFSFPQCLEELAELEALGSLVLFDHYQTNSYPEINDDGRQPTLHFQGLFHPLIDRQKVIANDFSYPTNKHLGLLTGSNMSGKSTFLRTVGFNQILSNAGAPVFAEHMTTSPVKIETCIEVSDSLRDGFSYFYAEVRRLKNLLAVGKSGEKTLVLIDEIFRGTNNRERQIGSRAVIRELANQTEILGFVSTHDLELTTLEQTLPGVLNLHFREDFSPDSKMIFSYKLHQGPCPTTNALKIMAAEGIDVASGESDV